MPAVGQRVELNKKLPIGEPRAAPASKEGWVGENAGDDWEMPWCLVLERTGPFNTWKWGEFGSEVPKERRMGSAQDLQTVTEGSERNKYLNHTISGSLWSPNYIMKQPGFFSLVLYLGPGSGLLYTAQDSRLQLMISEDNPWLLCSPEAAAPRLPLSHTCQQPCTSLNLRQRHISGARMVTASTLPALDIHIFYVFFEALSTPLLIKYCFSNGNLLSAVGHILWMKALFAGWRNGSEVSKSYFFIKGPEFGFSFPYPVAHKFLELLIKGHDAAFWFLWVSPYTCMRSHSFTHILNIICFGFIMVNLNWDVLLLSIMLLAEV